MAILVRSSERLTCRISLLFDRGGRRTGSASYDLPLSIPGKLRMLCNTKPMLLANTFPPIPCPSLFTGSRTDSFKGERIEKDKKVLGESHQQRMKLTQESLPKA